MSDNARAYAAFMQGHFVMDAQMGLGGALDVDHVEQETGPDGIYLPWFIVQTQDGSRVAVVVIPISDGGPPSAIDDPSSRSPRGSTP